MSSPTAHRAHPAVWAVLIIPYGASGGFVGVGLTFIATQHGLSITQGALLGGASLAAQWLRWLWAPLVDITLSPRRWYLLSNLVIAVTGVAMAAVPMTPSTLPFLLALIAASGVAASLLSMAVEVMMVAATTPDQIGRVSAWQQAGNLGGTGLGGGLGLYLLEHLPSPWMAGAITSALMLLCGLAWRYLTVPPPQRAGRHARAELAVVVRELWQTLRTRAGMLAALLLMLPVGTGAAAGVLTQAAVAGVWGAGANEVALTQGLLSGLVTAAGCFAGGWLCHRMQPRMAYIVVGVLLAGVDLAMVAAPTTVSVYIGGSLVYGFGVGIAYAAYTAVVLDSIGAGSAATKFSVMASLANFPIWWLGLLLGWVSDLRGPAAMLETEAALTVLGAVVFALALVWARPSAGRTR